MRSAKWRLGHCSDAGEIGWWLGPDGGREVMEVGGHFDRVSRNCCWIGHEREGKVKHDC